jgi:hypothetical protein
LTDPFLGEAIPRPDDLRFYDRSLYLYAEEGTGRHVASILASVMTELSEKNPDTVTFFPYQFRCRMTAELDFVALQSDNNHCHLLSLITKTKHRWHYTLVTESDARNISSRPDIVSCMDYFRPLSSSQGIPHGLISMCPSAPGDPEECMSGLDTHSHLPSPTISQEQSTSRHSPAGGYIAPSPFVPESDVQLIPSKRKNSEDEMGNRFIKQFYSH